MELYILRNKIVVDATDSVWCDIFGIPVFVRGSDGQIRQIWALTATDSEALSSYLGVRSGLRRVKLENIAIHDHLTLLTIAFKF